MGVYCSCCNRSSTKVVKVVVVGAGYAGICAAQALDSTCSVTIIESQDAFHHKIASIRGAVVPGWEKRTRIPLSKVLKRGTLIRADVRCVSANQVTLKDETTIEADFIVLAHGGGKSTFPCGKFTSFVQWLIVNFDMINQFSLTILNGGILLVMSSHANTYRSCNGYN